MTITDLSSRAETGAMVPATTGGHGHPGARDAFADIVIPQLKRWSDAGERAALVTIVQIDGAAPRPIGAQMAVSESGASAGYISGGCLEQALVVEAQQAIAEGRNRLVRYGEGSPYFDIRLPCGSGMELYVDQALPRETIADMANRIARREPFAWRADMAGGTSTLVPLPRAPVERVSDRQGMIFTRVYQPKVRCIVIGAGPIAFCTTRLAVEAGLDVAFYTPEYEHALGLMPDSVDLHDMNGTAPQLATDPWTGVLLSFHDHDLEVPLLTQIIDAPLFFLAAVGSRRAHHQRCAVLKAHGISDAAISRIRSPAGLIKGVKSAPLLALSMLAEMLSEAQARGYV
jgi:xanthine dehydrogenase accessory factor